MKFFSRFTKKEVSPEVEETPKEESTDAKKAQVKHDPAYTPKKGKPTPRRKDVERAKGIIKEPVAPAPMTRREARKREDQRYAGMSKEEKKAAKAKEAEEQKRIQQYRRERMAMGDDDFVLPRDKGPTRRFARNWVDARWTPISWLFPIVLILLIGTMIPNRTVQIVIQYFMYFFFVLLLVETVRIAVMVPRAAKQKFPEHKDTGFRLGWYAFMRATQPRRWRNPVPQTSPTFPWSQKKDSDQKSQQDKKKD
ncbi:MAG TPA: DUF3043 domain-containing protein [Corynebacteriales bacterium]|nr:DUF3043 domain-containing protein [Mycobacteriales bacterium]